METYYIELPKEFCKEHAIYQNGVRRFNYAVDSFGRYVASANTLHDFPELFENIADNDLPEVLILRPSDFPKPQYVEKTQTKFYVPVPQSVYNDQDFNKEGYVQKTTSNNYLMKINKLNEHSSRFKTESLGKITKVASDDIFISE